VFACICRAVTSDEVGAAIDGGAATWVAVAKATGACTGCGICRDRIKAMISDRRPACSRVAAPEPVPAG
jgi:bacterioferritin-associated ferredoxin